MDLDDFLLGIDFDEDVSDGIGDECDVVLTWVVTDIRVSMYVQSSGPRINEKILTLQLQNGLHTATCHLRDDWFRMEVEISDVAYISGMKYNLVLT